MEILKGYTLTIEEAGACINLIKKMREEKEKQRILKEQEAQIGAAVEVAISVIGLEETKRIMRMMTRALRETEKVEKLPF